MSDTDDRFRAMPDSEPKEPDEPDVPSAYSSAIPGQPNSFFFQFSKRNYISWQSQSDTAVLALIMLILVLVALVIIVLLSIILDAPDWTDSVAGTLGQVLLAIVGAVLGASGKR